MPAMLPRAMARPARSGVSTPSESATKNTGLRQRNRDRRHHEILMAAAAVFKRRGFENARIDQIADLASVSAGTVYNYFPTKEALLLALVIFYRAESAQARQKLVENPSADPLEAIYAYYSELLDRSLKYLDKKIWKHVQAASILGAWERFGNELMTTERNMIEEQTRILRNLKSKKRLPQGVDEGLLAEMIHAIGYFWWQTFLAQESLSIGEAKRIMRRRLRFLFDQMSIVA